MPSQPPPTPDNSDTEPLLTPEEFKALVARVGRSIKRVRVSQRMLMRANFLIFGSGVVWRWWSNTSTLGFALFAAMLGTETGIFLAWRRIGRNKATAERLLKFVANTCDVRQLGTILDLCETTRRLGSDWWEVNKAAVTAMLRLLPLMQSEDADVLDTPQRTHLRRELFHPGVPTRKNYLRGNETCFPILSALEKIGDKRDLPDVERLLKTDYITEEVRAVAERCAQTIREHLACEEGKDVLLRADRKPEAVETLLRPSAENATTPPQQLLRAATSEYSESEGQP